MLIRTGLPTYRIAGLTFRPGDILGRTKLGSFIEHHVLVAFDGAIAHSPGPADVFRTGWLEEILVDGGLIRVVYPSGSLRESYCRLARADRIMGVSWWAMNCHQTSDFIVGVCRDPWLM